MTTSGSDPDDPNTEGATLPPYEGRKEEADFGEESTKDGAKTAGAGSPVEDSEQKAPDPQSTPGGATASPADEQPAQEESEDPAEGPGATGPSHTPGTGRAED